MNVLFITFSKQAQVRLWIHPRLPISPVIPAQAGIQQGQTFREADKTAILSRFAEDF